MKRAFQGHYQLDQTELDAVWSEGILVIDTNALLNLYRYTRETGAEFTTAISAMSDQLWLPFQVGLEYHERRVDVISSQAKAYADMRSSLDRAKKAILDTAGKYRRHPVLSVEAIGAAVEVAMKPLADLVETAERSHGEIAVASVRDDPVLAAITNLFEGKVGAPYSAQQLAELYVQGQDRYDKKIPPGFKDNAKDEVARYGDFIIWMQILDKAEAEGKHVIFVTDDAKSDWWQEHDGEVLGPRTELRQEFFARSGHLIQFYRSEQFLKFSGEKRGTAVSEATLQEVDEVSSRDLYAVQAIAVDLMNDKRRSLLRSIDAAIGAYTRANTRLRSSAQLMGIQFDGRGAPEFDVLEDLSRGIASFTRHFRDSEEPAGVPFPFESEMNYWLYLRETGDVAEFNGLENVLPFQSPDVAETISRDLKSLQFARNRLDTFMREYVNLARQSYSLGLAL